MAFRAEHIATINPKDKYDKVVRVNKEKGVSFLIGTLPDGTKETQAVIFDADRVTPGIARQWLKDNGMDADTLEASTGKEKSREDSDEEFRFDSGATRSKFRVEPGTGFGHFDHATLSTVGVYKYKQADGTVRSEYRPASEVQSSRFIKSLQNCVVTREHPHPRGVSVNRGNVERLAIGTTGTDVTKAGLKLDSSLVVRQEAALLAIAQRVDAGHQVGLSVGYRCKTKPEAGTWHGPNGPVPYTHVQYGHVANHVAITLSTLPRGGLDKQHGTVLHLDSHEAEQLTEDIDIQMDNVIFNIGGLTISVLKSDVQHLQGHLDKLDSAAVDNASKIGTLEGEVAKLTEANTKLTTDSEEGPSIGELVTKRQKLLESALKVVTQKDLDKLDSDAEGYEVSVMALCMSTKKIEVPADLEGKAKESYMQARLDSMQETVAATSHASLSAAVGGKRPTLRTDSEQEDLNKRFRAAQEKLVENKRRDN